MNHKICSMLVVAGMALVGLSALGGVGVTIVALPTATAYHIDGNDNNTNAGVANPPVPGTPGVIYTTNDWRMGTGNLADVCESEGFFDDRNDNLLPLMGVGGLCTTGENDATGLNQPFTLAALPCSILDFPVPGLGAGGENCPGGTSTVEPYPMQPPSSKFASLASGMAPYKGNAFMDCDVGVFNTTFSTGDCTARGGYVLLDTCSNLLSMGVMTAGMGQRNPLPGPYTPDDVDGNSDGGPGEAGLCPTGETGNNAWFGTLGPYACFVDFEPLASNPFAADQALYYDRLFAWWDYDGAPPYTDWAAAEGNSRDEYGPGRAEATGPLPLNHANAFQGHVTMFVGELENELTYRLDNGYPREGSAVTKFHGSAPPPDSQDCGSSPAYVPTSRVTFDHEVGPVKVANHTTLTSVVIEKDHNGNVISTASSPFPVCAPLGNNGPVVTLKVTCTTPNPCNHERMTQWAWGPGPGTLTGVADCAPVGAGATLGAIAAPHGPLTTGWVAAAGGAGATCTATEAGAGVDPWRVECFFA